MNPVISDQQIAAVRDFNRFYTSRLGVLEQKFLDSPWSLTEARVLYELAHRKAPSAKEIAAALDIDAGYLSRILQNFSDKGLVTRKPLPADRRQIQLGLTNKGHVAAGRIDRSSQEDIASMLGRLAPADVQRVAQAMMTIERLLGNDTTRPAATLRAPRPGDMGWVIQSHGALYAAEYGFETEFEGLVAEIVAKFVASFDASRERCWIADIAGQPVGSGFLVRQSDEVARLRLLLVDPAGRGQGLGQRIVRECIGFARACGYRRITLSTHSILLAARKIYQNAGFMMVASEAHRSFGQNLTGETWELEL